ncbi:hypothetical protein K469DRAFT_193335 [Zopfia rhizophila CBS 207.26]|uniref:Uncharacterized protein n=1 Tax=Zopfia rhizophila CBS 207.26 TaxID=1314779 RepID=A0A6A6ESB8_9PEZI|nr:hypothetical protein K469DRAFT_193335 [Zopfia rhizophila CBS 207.26]
MATTEINECLRYWYGPPEFNEDEELKPPPAPPKEQDRDNWREYIRAVARHDAEQLAEEEEVSDEDVQLNDDELHTLAEDLDSVDSERDEMELSEG